MTACGNLVVLIILTLVTGVVCYFSFGGPYLSEFNPDHTEYLAYEQRTSWLDVVRIPLTLILILICIMAWLRRDSDIMMIVFTMAALTAAAISRLPAAAKLVCFLAAIGSLILYELQQGVPIGEIIRQFLDA